MTGGSLAVSEENTEVRFVASAELDTLPMHHTQRLRLRHFTEGRDRPYLS